MMNRQQQMDAARRRMQGKQSPPAAAAQPQPATRTGKKADGPIAYYDASGKTFWTLNDRSQWLNLTESSLKRILRYKVFCDLAAKEQPEAIDRELMRVQTEQDVAFAGPIAGYEPGIYTICGQRMLVTNGPKLLKPKEGDWSCLRAFINDLLGDARQIFYGWLKSALRSLNAGPPFRPGQMLAIAGPAGCGKSLLQNLITELLGGRKAKPYQYLTGETNFNSDLCGSEHLMVEDEAASTLLSIRRQFGSNLKNMIVNESQRMHGKGRDGLMISPFWRVTITLNDEPENLMVLPPLDESLKDKIIILRAFMPKFPYVTDDMDNRKEFRARLSNELPCLLKWLQSYRVPEKMLSQRYGVKEYHDAELAQELADLSPEIKLLSLIDSLQIWDAFGNEWEGTASQLEERLLEKDKLGRVGKLLSFNTACGAYLARLLRRFPERIAEKRCRSNVRVWTIKTPDK